MGGMTRNVRTYGHFCAVARALEQVGDRWSLLVIRDLLTGAKRFTDLMDRLGGIRPRPSASACASSTAPESSPPTARRAGGLVRADTTGADLGPVIDALSWWGLQHAWRRPRDGEPLHAEHLLRSATRAIDLTARRPRSHPLALPRRRRGLPGRKRRPALVTRRENPIRPGRRHHHRDHPSPAGSHLRRIKRRHRHHRRHRAGTPSTGN